MSKTCDNCKVEVSPVEILCEHCGYPLAGTEKEKAVFIGRQIAQQSAIETAKKFQRRSAYVLYAIGLIQILYSFANAHDNYSLIIHMALGVAFIVFGYFSFKRPVVFISLGLGLILLLYITDFLFDPSTLMRGILWKIAIVATLGYTLINTLEEIKIKQRNKSL